jgi:hypothetical protein
MMKIRGLFTFLSTVILLVGLLILSPDAHSAVKTANHASLAKTLGFPSWTIDTGWVGGSVGVEGYIKLGGGIGGTLSLTQESGYGKLDTCSEQLSFQGTSGSAEMDFGVEWWAKYRFVVLGLTYTGDMPFIGSTDLRLADTESFTPYRSGTTIANLSDSFPNQKIISYGPDFVVFSATVGASMSGSAYNKIDGVKLSTSRGTYTYDAQKIPVSLSGSSFSVSNIYKQNRSTLSLTFTPVATIKIAVWPFSYTINIPTFSIPVNIGSRLFTSTPLVSANFYSLPEPSPVCYNNDVYYYDDCGNREGIKEVCTYGCTGNTCDDDDCGCGSSPCDTDNDGILDTDDNCLNTCNIQQSDADGDDIGDVCDTEPGCGGCGQSSCEQECAN